MKKTAIVDELGEQSLLLPAYVEEALAANNRVKYLFTLLQEARRYADKPGPGVSDLRAERISAGLEDTTLDDVVHASQGLKEDRYFIPRLAEFHEQITNLVETMIAPVRIGNNQSARQYQQRLQSLVRQAPQLTDDEVTGVYIDRMTSGQRESGDSLHLLVMDLHKEINRIQSTLAQEIIDGARVYGIDANDRVLIEAFMRGLNRTAPLKFDHPGLETIATRHQDKLIIENDIGTTDAHVLVVHIRDCTVTITYTDIHARRAIFFKNLFEKYAVAWSDTSSHDQNAPGLENNRYLLCVGTFTAQNHEQLLEYLSFLGSRLVYLIDWNKARKRLRNFLKKQDCLLLLKWAADNDHGHRGFLQIGGERVIYEALAQVSRSDIHYGDRLDELLGHEQALEYLKYVLQTAADGLLRGKSERLIRDEIKVEIYNYFQTAQQGIFEICADHAAIIFNLADAVRNALIHAGDPSRMEFIQRTAARAKVWETRADNFLNQIREVSRRSRNGSGFSNIPEEADDVADSLEEIAYLLTLLPDLQVPPALYQPLQALSDLVVEGTQDYVKCIETARQLQNGGKREDLQDFLEAVDQIVTIEHRTDASERRMITALLKEAATDSRQMNLLSLLARTFEEAADSLARCALMMKNYVIDEVMAR